MHSTSFFMSSIARNDNISAKCQRIELKAIIGTVWNVHFLWSMEFCSWWMRTITSKLLLCTKMYTIDSTTFLPFHIEKQAAACRNTCPIIKQSRKQQMLLQKWRIPKNQWNTLRMLEKNHLQERIGLMNINRLQNYSSSLNFVT